MKTSNDHVSPTLYLQIKSVTSESKQTNLLSTEPFEIGENMFLNNYLLKKKSYPAPTFIIELSAAINNLAE